MRLRMGVRHAAVVLVVVVLGGLTAAGIVGPAVGRERIHAFDVTAIINEDRTVTVREVIDYDFGGERRRGIFRTIPTGGGIPEQIEVSSPTAPDQLHVRERTSEIEIRIGDPDERISGRHRYVISYVLPATIVDDVFALDAIGTDWNVPIEQATVQILGGDLDGPRCFTGRYLSTETCPLTEDDEGIAVALDDLAAETGITVDGTVTATRAATFPDLPPFEDRDSSSRWLWTGVVVGLGLITGLVVFVISRQVGRNEVAGDGATEAAFVPFGEETFGIHHDAPGGPPPPVAGARMVADSDMADLAGVDFVPPGGIEPWQAAVVAREIIDDRTIGAWFASQAAHDILVIEKEGDDVHLRPGPQAATADATVAPILNRAMARRSQIKLGTYNPSFASAWKEAGIAVDGWSVGSQTFRRRPPRYPAAAGCATIGRGGGAFIPIAVLFALFAAGGGPASGVRTAFAAIALAVLVPTGVAFLAYRRLTRSLSARGSAIALRTESFRRFLHDSEAEHVEWAWQNGLLREYSAWAVALGEVDAWNSALASSSVPPAEVHTTTGILAPAIYASSFHSTTTAPSSSGSSGGGFSGGGSVGGGGGGGGGGSW